MMYSRLLLQLLAVYTSALSFGHAAPAGESGQGGPRLKDQPMAKSGVADPKFREEWDSCRKANLLHNDYELTPANWVKLDMDGWLTKYWNSKTDKSKGLVGQLYLDFTGRRMEDEGHCGINDGATCVAVDCDAIFYDVPDHKQGLFALRAAGSLVQYLKSHFKALNIATWDAGMNKENFIHQLSFDGQLKGADNAQLGKELVMGASTVISIALAFVPSAGPLAALFGGVAGAVTDGIGTDNGPKPNPFVAEARIGSFLDTTTQASRKVLEDLVKNLLSGNPFKTGKVDMSLGMWLTKGSFVQINLSDKDTDLRQYYEMALGSKILNALWKWDSTYIIAAGSPDCNNDENLRYVGSDEQRDRAKPVKWCDPNDPGTAYYIMAYGISGEPYPHIIQPRGFGSISQFPEFTTAKYPVDVQKIIESSVGYWKAKGQHNGVIDGPLVDPNALTAATGKGAAYPGIFTIPVCASRSGHSMSSLSSDDMRAYPCTCDPDAERQFVKGDHSPVDKPRTAEFLQAANIRDTDLDRRYNTFISFCSQQVGGQIPFPQPS